MPISLYNSLTRRTELFTPFDPARVTMYLCGPTVYNYVHIGNARGPVVFDVLARLLRRHYPQLVYARNITDVDDKINTAAQQQGVPIGTITDRFAQAYREDMAGLGVAPPDIEPHATTHIGPIITMIEKLLDGGHAYAAEGHVLFDVGSFAAYGELSGRNPEELLAGARVEVAPYKRNAGDFVLWKPSTPDLPGWDSPWGVGRPGWHIECSAMSAAHLGDTIDIHAGGVDLLFPHHENEIAQSTCAHGSPVMARTWMHNGFLQVEGKKMSKSEGNFVTIHELLETETFGGRRWPGEVLRLAMLMTHYREPIDFSVARLEEAEEKLRAWQRAAGAATRDAVAPPEPTVVAELMDDLNFHRASVCLDVVVRKANRGVQTAADCTAATLGFLGFGLDTLLRDAGAADVDTAGIESAIAARLAALEARDFPAADRIRADLLAQGNQLKDAKDAAGKRMITWEVKR
jgi:cysteinyl-tRNA synthetase